MKRTSTSTRTFVRGSLCLLGFLILTDSVQAQAIDVSGLGPWQGRDVKELVLVGLPPELADSAKKGLALTPRRKLLRIRRATLSLKLAEADARRLRLLLARSGYPEATVTGQGEAIDDDAVKVTLTVVPGGAVVLGEIEVTGLPELTANVADSLSIPLASGQRFTDSAVQSTRDALFLAMQRSGYAEPAVELTVTRPDSLVCDVRFDCTPGSRFVFRSLRVEGSPADLEPLVRRTVGLQPGTPFSPEYVSARRRFVRDLQLFRQVRFFSEAVDSSGLELVADLKARQMITVGASVGSFTDNWFVIRAGAVHRNLFKRGRGFGMGAAYAAHLTEAEMRTWWPALFMARSTANLRLRYEIQDEDAYKLNKTELEFWNLFQQWRHSNLRVGVAVSDGKLDNRSADEEAFASDVGFQTVFSSIWYNDTSDNPLNPLRGRRLTLQGDWSPPGILSEKPFAAVRAYGSKYLPLGGERTLAMRLDGAIAWPLGDAVDLSPDRRYFAGGVSTHRGYRRRRLGPVDSAGSPVGGEVRILAGAEVRLPVKSIIGLALFVDAGQVWFRSDHVHLDDLALAGGAGLLFNTPIGPLRFDFAHNITDPVNNQPRSILSFAIGHPY